MTLDDCLAAVLAQTSALSKGYHWTNEHFWVPLEKGQTWVECILPDARRVEVARGLIQLRDPDLKCGEKHNGRIWVSE